MLYSFKTYIYYEENAAVGFVMAKQIRLLSRPINYKSSLFNSQITAIGESLEQKSHIFLPMKANKLSSSYKKFMLSVILTAWLCKVQYGLTNLEFLKPQLSVPYTLTFCSSFVFLLFFSC